MAEQELQNLLSNMNNSLTSTSISSFEEFMDFEPFINSDDSNSWSSPLDSDENMANAINQFFADKETEAIVEIVEVVVDRQQDLQNRQNSPCPPAPELQQTIPEPTQNNIPEWCQYLQDSIVRDSQFELGDAETNEVSNETFPENPTTDIPSSNEENSIYLLQKEKKKTQTISRELNDKSYIRQFAAFPTPEQLVFCRLNVLLTTSIEERIDNDYNPVVFRSLKLKGHKFHDSQPLELIQHVHRRAFSFAGPKVEIPAPVIAQDNDIAVFRIHCEWEILNCEYEDYRNAKTDAKRISTKENLNRIFKILEHGNCSFQKNYFDVVLTPLWHSKMKLVKNNPQPFTYRVCRELNSFLLFKTSLNLMVEIAAKKCNATFNSVDANVLASILYKRPRVKEYCTRLAYDGKSMYQTLFKDYKYEPAKRVSKHNFFLKFF
ncbi:hypothetical protein V1514DRAFT_361070 [Lipomyces japonicus]|uniref:uncharacterized protein n=1 Tax=Lipomyces japonicus TaxID=56871 RepID=UPI0034CEF04C